MSLPDSHNRSIALDPSAETHDEAPGDAAINGRRTWSTSAARASLPPAVGGLTACALAIPATRQDSSKLASFGEMRGIDLFRLFDQFRQAWIEVRYAGQCARINAYFPPRAGTQNDAPDTPGRASRQNDS
ncbi:MAG: hypothetical protein C5B56_15390 [Proteobacteria bacterium]|nr:MAG: hypothetical protein C5B56_15390 [Pseudomonadota bacterium]